MKKRIPPRLVPFLVGGLVLVLAAAGYLLLISPQRSQSSALQAEIESTKAQIIQARPRPESPRDRVRMAELFRLGKALPSRVDMPGILLELNRIAGETATTFHSITPRRLSTVGTQRVLPIDLVFEGNFYGLNDFLFRLRNLVSVHSGTLDASGRLFSVENLRFGESEQEKFPHIRASLTVNAYVFTPPPPVAPPTAPAADGTGVTPPPAEPSGTPAAAAAGATS